MTAVTDIVPSDLYGSLRDEVINLVRPLPGDVLNQAVPLTPGWTNTEVVAHVCGLTVDVIDGIREGLGTAETTSRQVAERAGRSLEEVCEEWLDRGSEFGEVITNEPILGLRLSADLVVHLHDMQHGLGESIDRTSVGSISGGRTYASRTPDRLSEVGNVAVTIELSDGSRHEPNGAGDGVRALTLQTTPYDFLRSVTGRRSRAQVAALGWSDDPGDLLDVFSPYGALRTDDAGV